MCPFQWQLKTYYSAALEDPVMLIPLLKECKQCIGWWLQGERWASGIPHQLPHPSLPYTNASVTGWGTHLRDFIAARVWSREEKELYINVLDMKLVQLALNAFLPRILGESVVLVSDSATVMLYLKKTRGNCFQGDVLSSTGDYGLVGTAPGDAFCEIHPREEEHVGGPFESPRPGLSNVMVFPSPGVRCHLRGVRSS